MSETKDRLLTNAGGLLMAAGFLAAFTGGMYGLAHTDPGLVVLSVALLIGYGVVGYLLTQRGAEYYHFALPAAAVLVLATLFIFRTDMGDWLDDGTGGQYFLYPLLTLILAFAGGALLTHAVEQATPRFAWPGKGAPSLNPLLHVAAYAPVWNAFTLLDLLGRPATLLRTLILGASVLVSIACVVGGYAASRKSHPAFTLAGASLGFAASVLYLYQFMLGGGERSLAFFGQFNALLGLILTGLPIAISLVAWIQIASARRADPEAAPDPADA